MRGCRCVVLVLHHCPLYESCVVAVYDLVLLAHILLLLVLAHSILLFISSCTFHSTPYCAERPTLFIMMKIATALTAASYYYAAVAPLPAAGDCGVSNFKINDERALRKHDN